MRPRPPPWLLVGWILLAGIACREDELPPPPIATSGSPPTTAGAPDGGAAGSGADETGGAGVLGDPCDVWAQDCPPSHKCMPIGPEGSFIWDESRCAPLSEMPVLADESCSMANGPLGGFDDCPAGTFCYFTDPSGYGGQCLPFCEGSPEAPECPAGMACGWGNDGAVALCRPTCDPIAQDCERSNAACLPVASGTEFVCYVHQWELGGVGCSAHNACPRGQACVPGEQVDVSLPPAVNRCTSFCDDFGAECGTGRTCQPWPDGTPDGHPSVGACMAP
jgi:hypothetical protein